MSGDSFPLLTTLVVLPAVLGLFIACLPKERTDVIRAVALVGSSVVAALSVYLGFAFEVGNAGFQFVSDHVWVEDLGISWKLGVDGISLFLVVLTGVLFPIALYGPKVKSDLKSYCAWMLLLEAGCIGSFVALDLFAFFLFFEAVLVPMYFLISGWGYENRGYASVKFFLYTLAGSALMLVAMLVLVVLHAQGAGNELTFDVVTLARDPGVAGSTARWLFLAFALAFAVKVPLVPVHTWLPDAHTEAPTAGSMILAAVMLKLGTYGLLRFGVYLFPEAAVHFAPLFLTLGVVGIIYGAIVATVQKDFKRLVAYSSIAHLGFIVLGTFALNQEAISGAVLQMINHGISTGALFLLVGMIYERRHTRQISELRGLQEVAPIMAGVFMVVMLSSIGLPGLNGFVGEFLILIGSFDTARWWAVVATAGVILSAVYMLWAYQRVFHGEPDAANEAVADLSVRERIAVAPLLLMIVAIGVFPRPLLDRIEPSVDRLIIHVETQTEEKAAKR